MDKPLCFFLLYLQSVESFTINSDYITLRNKGIFIDVSYQSEYFIGFVFLSKYYYNLDALFAIPTGTVQQSNPTAKLFGDGFGYFFVFS